MCTEPIDTTLCKEIAGLFIECDVEYITEFVSEKLLKCLSQRQELTEKMLPKYCQTLSLVAFFAKGHRCFSLVTLKMTGMCK